MKDNFDGITIGDTITEQFLNNGTFNSEAIGKGYDLKLRSDLISSQAKYNVGENDTSIVFEVVETFNQSINTLFQNAKDHLNSAIATLDVEHYEIHEGDHFFYSTVFSLASGATAIYTLKTGAKPIHFVFSTVGNDAGISGNTYENVTANEDGTLITINNNNRNSANTTTTTIRFNPTGLNTTGSVLLRTFRAGTGGTPLTRSAGSISRGNEIIFKPNTKYSLSITNLSTSTNNVSFETSWYEL